jgi:hypothetical protein
MNHDSSYKYLNNVELLAKPDPVENEHVRCLINNKSRQYYLCLRMQTDYNYKLCGTETTKYYIKSFVIHFKYKAHATYFYTLHRIIDW